MSVLAQIGIIEIVASVLATAVVIALGIIVLGGVSGSFKGGNNEGDCEPCEDEGTEETTDFEPTLEYARVISKRIEDGYSARHKYPAYKMFFLVTFLTDKGETKEFFVEEEVYKRVYEHQAGMLMTINGNFLDFGDGEEITE